MAALKAPDLRLVYKHLSSFVRDTPGLWEIIKRRLVNRSTGISPLRGSLRAAPICCDGSRTMRPLQRSTLWRGRSLFDPIACNRHAGDNPVFIAGSFSLIAGQVGGIPPSCVPRHHGASANVAHAGSHSNGRMCLMNGYSVFCFSRGACCPL